MPLRERLLAVMDRKHHWAYPNLTRAGLTRDQLFAHFKHEYLVYVRDFPVLLARVLGNVPAVDEVRRALAENVYEEQTGGLSRTDAHPALFLKMMAGLGFAPSAFADPASRSRPRRSKRSRSATTATTVRRSPRTSVRSPERTIS